MSATTCPSCGSPVGEQDKFCEVCGASLTVSPPVAEEGSAGEGLAEEGSAGGRLAEVLDVATKPLRPPAPAFPAPVPSGPRPWHPATPAATGGEPDAGEASPSSATPEASATGQTGTCVRCGGVIAPDGYCLSCGEPAASPRDHFRISPAPWLGGVCDRGVVHARNEDAMALGMVAMPPPAPGEGEPVPAAVLVVCDGVSSAPNSDVASLAAADAALATITAGLPTTGLAPAAVTALLAQAAQVADQAVETNPPAADGEAPSCTYVACVVGPGIVATAWVGDSRAYWLPDSGTPIQLTRDHSWAQEMIEQGMAREEAEAAPQAHAITRWLGADAPDGEAPTTVLAPSGPGWVLVCSDGLWNYCSPAEQLRTLVSDAVERVGSDPTEIADELVRWACAQGGRDNVTVALARVGE